MDKIDLTSSKLKFSNHAKYIIDTKKYGWKAIDGNLGYGIMAVGPGPDGIIRTWKILPSQDYPNTPPIVFAEPEYKGEPFFKNGQLDYNEYMSEKDSSWLKCVNDYFNPLIPLINETFYTIYKPPF